MHGNPNLVLQTRFLLNYKKVDYRTEWIEYPDVKPTFEPHLSPNKEGTAYTIPTVAFPDETWVMESRAIVDEIEKRYPSPSVYLDSPQLTKLEGIMPKLMPLLSGIYIPLVPKRLLNEASQPHWYTTREARFGMPLDRLAQEKGGQSAWDNAKPLLDEVTAMLKEHEGVYFKGQEVSYTDFVWGGFLIFFQRIGSDVYEKLLQTVGEGSSCHDNLLLGLEKWSLRSDR